MQIILRRYLTSSEVVHGFDLGSCSTLYDGSNVFFTSLGKLAYEYGVNVLDLSRRRATYEHRICKYFTRGFGLILPHFTPEYQKMVKVQYSMYFDIEMPFLAGRCIGVHGSVFEISMLRRRAEWDAWKDQPRHVTHANQKILKIISATPEKAAGGDSCTGSEYGPSVNYHDTAAMAERNFFLARSSSSQISSEKLKKGLFACAECEGKLDIFNFPVNFDDLALALRRRCIGVLQTRAVLHLYGSDVLTVVLKALTSDKWYVMDHNAQLKFFKEVCDKFVKELPKERLELPFHFTSTTDGTTLRSTDEKRMTKLTTGSQFLMEITSVKAWYGGFSVKTHKLSS